MLQPEQLEIALRALKELQERSQAIDRQWQMRIERLEYQAQLAQRRYQEDAKASSCTKDEGWPFGVAL